ncbi:MAG: DUF4065 domain-containing protein [Campylobacteraceae bacterium]|jgi:uncharacterized phage-associated protein|nr:DUF4065 domain-containing protein [Campylobacteraceae bacterium]
MAKITAMDVAKYAISKCQEDNHPITNLQLQKMLYYIQYFFLVKTEEPLFDDDFEAWKFGPVISNVYYEYRIYGALPIDLDGNKIEFNNINIEDKKLLDYVIEKTRVMYPWRLVEQSHAKGKAWDSVFMDGFGAGDIIEKMDIKNNGF